MFLKSLEIQGFKSFSDKTVLTFGRGITAVVGPNGSGKSNISDAIRWVLGEMSAKTLRGSRMEDVIFGGTVLRRPQGFAEVTLTLDNTGRELAFDSDEVSVTRRYYRSGESDYLLNRNPVRLKDVYELFMDTGLGRDGYSVIGQGRIAEIVAARSEDRREIFEEAAGISKYRYRKEESERRLTAAQENLDRLRDILSELEARVGPLKEQSEKAKKYIDLAGEKKTLEVGLWLYTLDKRAEALRGHDTHLELARAQYGDVEEQLDKLSAEMEQAYLRTQQSAAKAEEYRGMAKELEAQAADAEAQAAVKDSDIRHGEENAARLRKEAEAARSRGAEQEQELKKRREALAQLEERAKEIDEELKSCEQGAQELTRSSGELDERTEKAGGRLSRAGVELAKIKQQASSDEAMAAALGERLQAAQTDAGTRAQRLEEAEQAGKQAEARLAELTDKAESLRNSLGGYAMKLDSRRARLGEAEEKNKALSLKISEKAQRAAALEELERHMEGFARSVKVIMKRRSEGMLDGIHGPVSRLMTVPAKYAVAVETALGAAAQNIVVSDEEAAKAAIRYLKETDSGRATFLPMTSVRGRRLEARGAESCAGYIGTASELIGCDEKYGEIMRSLLGRTVVAQDLDSAVTMAKRFGYSFRVVTLDGQLVNAGGSLTGGSMSRTAGLLSRAGEIQELRAACGGLREKYAQAEADAKKLREEVASLEASVSGINGELATVQEDIIRAEGERRQSAAQAQTLRDDVAALARENETARIRLAELGKAAEEARQKTAELEKAQAQAQKELEELGVSRAQIENKRSEQAERFTRLRLDSLACGKDAENVRREIDDMTAAGSDRQSRIDAVAQQLAQLAAEGSQLADEAAALRQKAADLRQEAERRVGDAKAETEKNQDEEKESVARHAKERSLSEDKEKLSGELARLEERRAAAQTDYDGLISRLWEEYGLTRSEAEKISPASAEPAAAQRRLNSVKKEIKDLGDVNVGAIEEYRAVSERYEFLKNQTEDVEKSKFELMSLIGTLTEKMRSIFTEKFSQIDKNFSETFIELFGGGSARLELTQPDDVLTSGIEITVQPPGKIIKSLAALSGGEQAFVAIALYFAILKVRPSPFCVLDEIEAALDDANVSRFAAYLRRMCADTQFIVITHRRGTMDEADVLYGVTMQDEGVSKLLTLNVGELADKLGIRA